MAPEDPKTKGGVISFERFDLARRKRNLENEAAFLGDLSVAILRSQHAADDGDWDRLHDVVPYIEQELAMVTDQKPKKTYSEKIAASRTEDEVALAEALVQKVRANIAVPRYANIMRSIPKFGSFLSSEENRRRLEKLLEEAGTGRP